MDCAQQHVSLGQQEAEGSLGCLLPQLDGQLLSSVTGKVPVFASWDVDVWLQPGQQRCLLGHRGGSYASRFQAGWSFMNMSKCFLNRFVL